MNVNHLNSLVIEGVVVGEPHCYEETNRFELNIETIRTVKADDGKEKVEHYLFFVVGFGSCPSCVKKGDTIRLVGRLEQNSWKDPDGVTHSKVYIVAEHIDHKNKK